LEPALGIRSSDPRLEQHELEDDGFEELRVSRVAGIDVSLATLQSAADNALGRKEALLTPEGDEAIDAAQYWSRPRLRWSSIDASLWRGSFETINPAFFHRADRKEGYEAIVAMEIIEHLSPAVLPSFAPVLLGTYRPRLLLVTTPAYEYNARFARPGAPRRGFADPTGRTTHVFRHPDHKFEFTRDEFDAYCNEAAAAHGYTVTFHGIGISLEPDPFGRDAETGHASQGALFRRISSSAPSAPAVQQPAPLAARSFTAHPCAGLPAEPTRILEAARAELRRGHSDVISLRALWLAPGVAIACGGDPRALVAALRQNTAWALERASWDADARWLDYVEPPPEPKVEVREWDSCTEMDEELVEAQLDADQPGDRDDLPDAGWDNATTWASLGYVDAEW